MKTRKKRGPGDIASPISVFNDKLDIVADLILHKNLQRVFNEILFFMFQNGLSPSVFEVGQNRASHS